MLTVMATGEASRMQIYRLRRCAALGYFAGNKARVRWRDRGLWLISKAEKAFIDANPLSKKQVLDTLLRILREGHKFDTLVSLEPLAKYHIEGLFDSPGMVREFQETLDWLASQMDVKLEKVEEPSERQVLLYADLHVLITATDLFLGDEA